VVYFVVDPVDDGDQSDVDAPDVVDTYSAFAYMPAAYGEPYCSGGNSPCPW
jgi:hypothetical protein